MRSSNRMAFSITSTWKIEQIFYAPYGLKYGLILFQKDPILRQPLARRLPQSHAQDQRLI